MSSPVSVIVLAGEGKDSRRIHDRSKLYLAFQGEPLLVRLLSALEKVPGITGVCVVGPGQRIREVLQANEQGAMLAEWITIVEQRDNIYENCEAGVSHFIPEYTLEGSPISEAQSDQSFLLLPVDMPFVTPAEITEFLTGAANHDLDYAVGMTEEAALKAFQPADDLPGIAHNYLHLGEGNYRLNNLHLIKPFKVLNRGFIAKMYTRRHQGNVINVLQTLWDFMVAERMGPGPVGFFVYLEFLVLLRHLRLHRWVDRLRKFASRQRVAEHTSKLLGARVAIVETRIGGCAIDIDSDEDYRAVEQRYSEWSKLIKGRIAARGDTDITVAAAAPVVVKS